MKSIKVIISTLIVGITATVYAQQDPQYTQYMYNHSVINPAYVGTLEDLTIYGQYRAQWIGLDGAPQTANFSVSGPLGNKGVSGGISFVNDRIGAMNDNTISLDLGYTINLNYEYKLAFGLKGQLNILDVDYTKLDIYHTEDPMLRENINNKFTPNIGVGLMVYSDRSYFGISAPSLLSTYRYNDNEAITKMKKEVHMFVTGGYVFDIGSDVFFKPAFLMKAVQGAPLQVDLTANFLFSEKYTAGIAYRWDAAISGLVGFQVTDNLMIGYSYDADTTSLQRFNSGSHEVFMKFTLFNRDKTKVMTTRFF